MKRISLGCALAAGWILGTVALAGATMSPACVRSAISTRKACVAQCVDQFQLALDQCRHIDPGCGDACRAGRATCTRPYLATLDGCLDGCQTTLTGAIAACPPPGDPARDACVDAAQVAAFTCRDTCREDPIVRTGIKACDNALRACLRACPPAP